MEPHEKLIGEAKKAAWAAMAGRPFRSQPSYEDVLAMIEAAVGVVVRDFCPPASPPLVWSGSEPLVGGEGGGSGDGGSA